MKRKLTNSLIEWLGSENRKPLVIRGARQVGKTWLIRNLAEITGKQLIELNFERRPDLETLFSSNEPHEILNNISGYFGKKIDISNALLFLDEIQVAPKLLAKLRWFAEDMPQLPVVAAGSLLDFAFADHEFSMPVGRISYMYLEPLSFEEFIEAIGHTQSKVYLQQYDIQQTIPAAIHQQLTSLMNEYLLIGGMPAAVVAWINQKNFESVNQVQFDLLATYREDFAKYRGRLTPERLEEIFAAIPRQLGGKFVYSNAKEGVSTPPLKQALELLVKACFCSQVFASSANGLPLNAEKREKFFKVILVDVGLVSASLGLTLYQLNQVGDLSLINSGGVSEQLVGQQLRTLFPPFVSPSLNYWERSGSVAEVDYVIQYKNKVLPIEVKAGKRGTLKSLHEFMFEKKLDIAVRINSDYPSLVKVKIKNPDVEYQLLSIPFYLTGQLFRILDNKI